MSPRPGFDTLDLVARTERSTLTATTSLADDGDIIVRGQLSGLDVSAPTSPVRVVLPSSVSSTLSAREVEPGLVKLFSGEEESAFQIYHYSVVSAIEDRYEIHSGSLVGPGGTIYCDFAAMTDPFHIPIIGAVLIVGGCALWSGVSFLSEWVQARTSGWCDACLASGNFPFVVPVFRWSASLWRGEAKCEASARIECRDVSGRVISANQTPFERLQE